MSVRRADDTAYTLGSSLSADGADVLIKGGKYHFMANGTIGTGSVSLQIKDPDGNYSDVLIYGATAVKLTALPGNQTGIDLPAGAVRVHVAAGSTGVNAYLIGLG